MKDSEFVFACVHLLYYKCHKINSNHVRLYIDPTEWMKTKNNNNKSHQRKRQLMSLIRCNTGIKS